LLLSLKELQTLGLALNCIIMEPMIVVRDADELVVGDTSPADGTLLLQGAHIVKDNGEVDTAFDISSPEALYLNGSAGKPFA
jgi:hypothetical protein